MFEFHQFLGQVPESFVEGHVAIDAFHGPALRHPATGRLPLSVVLLSALGGVLQHNVERPVCVVAAVLVTARLKQLHRTDWRGFNIADTDDGCGYRFRAVQIKRREQGKETWDGFLRRDGEWQKRALTSARARLAAYFARG